MEHIRQSIETFLSVFLPKGVVEWILACTDALGIYVMIQINTGEIHKLNLLLESLVEIATFVSIVVTVIIKILRYKKNG